MKPDSLILLQEPINPNAQELWNKYVNKSDRLAIVGASGWVGRTAIALAIQSKTPFAAFGSKRQNISVLGESVSIFANDTKEILKFSPTVIIDAAFLTREKVEQVGLRKYIDTNQALIEQSKTLARITSLTSYLGFSSGAAHTLGNFKSFNLEENPYAALKREYEMALQSIYSEGYPISIARLWSISGAFVSKPDLFAFTNLIRQAFNGAISIQSGDKVFRRYSSIEDVISLAIASSRTDQSKFDMTFDSGGQRIEIGELARDIRNIVNPSAEITRENAAGLLIDDYCSNNADWLARLKHFKLKPDSLDNQIMRTAAGMI